MSPLRPTRLFTALFIIGLADSTEMECVGSCNQLHAGGQSCVPISTAPDLKYCADQDPASWKVILLQFQETTDYTIMFAFAIVDQNCNPPTSISSASLMQQKQVIVKENGAEASASETFSGMVDSKIAIKIKYLLLMDQSNSVLSQESTDFFAWATALIDAANSSQTQKVQASVAIAGFDGREQIILHADFTSDFASLKVSLNEKLNRETLMGDPNRDVSTNLNGALDQAITILSKSDDALATAVPVLVIFTDGADKANRVKWPTVKKRAQDFPGSMYLACVPGETDSDKEYKEFQEVAGRSGKVDINSASLTGLSDVIRKFAYLAARRASNILIYIHCGSARKGASTMKIEASAYGHKFLDEKISPETSKYFSGSASKCQVSAPQCKGCVSFLNLEDSMTRNQIFRKLNCPNSASGAASAVSPLTILLSVAMSAAFFS